MADKPVTVTELKTFIEAVEFASDQENWVPSDRQWKRIRQMIERLEDTPAAQPPAAPIQYAQPRQLPIPAVTPEAVPPTQLLPSLPPAMLAPQQPLAGPFATGSVGAVRTPDIDTGHGKPYQSAFA